MNLESTVTIPAAFVFGLLSFFSPCVLPLVPAYLSYISGVSVEELSKSQDRSAVGRTGLRSLLFVAGFSTVFVAMGATATSVGQLLAEHMRLLMKIGGVVIVIFGLHMLGVFRIRALYSEKRFHSKLSQVGYAGAFVIGVMFALGWTPCIGPVLASILALAGSSETVMQGVALLAIYSLGLGIPFLATGLLTGTAFRVLSKFKRHFRTVEIVSGLLIIAVGALVFVGGFQALGTILGG